MAKRTDLQKHTLNLRTGDYERIKDVFDPKGIPASRVIQHIVSKFVDNLKPQNESEELAKIQGDIE